MYPLMRNTWWVPLSFIGVFILTISLRPLLPIDETRYLTVAWEMFLRHDWLAPLTMNGEPYHHKPPLLFWLINSVWSITGPSRWSATIPPVLAGLIDIYLAIALAQKLFKNNQVIAYRVPLIMIGCLPFLVYSSMVMFDVTLAAFVLGSLLGLIAFYETQKRRYVLLVALLLGLGVLTKGPVAYLYVIFPMIFGPLWQRGTCKASIWYASCFISVLLSIIPVLLWLVPVLHQSDSHFAFWLVWEQTAGRVTGNFNDAHVRPFWFYLPIVPLIMIPWIFFPRFWTEIKSLRDNRDDQWGIKFLLCWIVPVFISFSLISGKQPHYLVPLMPGLMILMAYTLRKVDIKVLQKTTAALFFLFVAAHFIGSQTFLKDYDLKPIAAFIEQNPKHSWAFNRKYHGEVSFLARREQPIDVVQERSDVLSWFEQHPDGFMIMRYKNRNEIADYDEVFSLPYRGKSLGVFRYRAAGEGDS